MRSAESSRLLRTSIQTTVPPSLFDDAVARQAVGAVLIGPDKGSDSSHKCPFLHANVQKRMVTVGLGDGTSVGEQGVSTVPGIAMTHHDPNHNKTVAALSSPLPASSRCFTSEPFMCSHTDSEKEHIMLLQIRLLTVGMD